MIVSTIAELGPAFVEYGGVLLIVFYVFAIVGMEVGANRERAAPRATPRRGRARG